jgi:hypothetical protein
VSLEDSGQMLLELLPTRSPRPTWTRSGRSGLRNAVSGRDFCGRPFRVDSRPAAPVSVFPLPGVPAAE